MRRKAWVIGVPAALVAVFTIVTFVLQAREKSQRLKALLKTAEQYQDVDDFDTALSKIDEALLVHPDDQAIRIRRLELDTFRNATQYDQTHHLKDKQVVKTLQDSCKQLRNEVGDDSRVLVLCGIVEELDDHPTRAIQDFYEKAVGTGNSRYASGYNAWGYTIYKWQIGDKDWPTGALDKFSKAAEMSPRYVWPYVNIAMVNLIEDHLDEAKLNLDAATQLLPKNPRIHQLWGAYYMALGERYKAHRLPESRPSVEKAVDEFQEAKDENANLADVRANLGGALEELGDRDDDAFHEYEVAATLDKWNLQACADHARLLAKRGLEKAASELARCGSLVSDLRSDATMRLHETNDTAARLKLSQDIVNYDHYQAEIRRFSKLRRR